MIDQRTRDRILHDLKPTVHDRPPLALGRHWTMAQLVAYRVRDEHLALLGDETADLIAGLLRDLEMAWRGADK